MEYIDGEDLANYLFNQGVLSESEALRYILQVGDALTTVHKQGLLHRDIKPENIILRNDASGVVLIDFGIARDFIPNQTQTHTQFSSDGYSPIEQYNQRAKRGTYTDTYALAATLYSLLTRKVPVAAYLRALGTPLELPRRINSNISIETERAILKGMAFQPHERPISVQEWLEMLNYKYKAQIEKQIIKSVYLSSNTSAIATTQNVNRNIKINKTEKKIIFYLFLYLPCFAFHALHFLVQY
jgi:eukaryotic-like serine/threonine-protein kinase